MSLSVQWQIFHEYDVNIYMNLVDGNGVKGSVKPNLGNYVKSIVSLKDKTLIYMENGV